MSKRRFPLLLLLGVALTLALASGACGGDGAMEVESGSVASPTLTTPVDSIPPMTAVSYDEGWQQGPARVAFTVQDDCCSPDECTIYHSTDGKDTWQEGGEAVVRAQGESDVWFYAVDATGNEEDPDYCAVKIDNGRPVTKALNAPSVQQGKTVTLKYRIEDRTPRATAWLVLKGPSSKTIKLGSQPTDTQCAYKLKANLPAGTYSWTIKATDLAGNVAKQRVASTLLVKPKPVATASVMVGITESGECYHRLTCYHWTKHPAGNTKVTVSQAKAWGYRPCKICDPPQ